MLNCLITEVRFDDCKTVRRENRNVRYPAYFPAYYLSQHIIYNMIYDIDSNMI